MTNYKISQEDVLKVLTSKPQSVAEIARKIGVFKGTPKKHLLRLEAQGLATKTDEGWIKIKDVNKVAQPKVSVHKVTSPQSSGSKSLSTSKHIPAITDEIDTRILDAALKIFSIKGYSGATTREIAHEANVNEVTIFRKFKSKENLLKEVLNSNLAVFASLDDLFQIQKDVDLETELRFLGKNIAKAMKDKKMDNKSQMHMFMHMLFEEGKRRPEVAEVLLAFLQTIINPLSKYFESQIKNGKMRNINPQTAALTFISYFGYTPMLREVFGDDFMGDSDEEIEGFIDIFTKGTLKVNDMKTSR
jgi:AcrR family transcriptional regulator